MILIIETTRPDRKYNDYKELEIESFRWNENHEFEYVIKKSCRISKLEPNQNIVGLHL